MMDGAESLSSGVNEAPLPLGICECECVTHKTPGGSAQMHPVAALRTPRPAPRHRTAFELAGKYRLCGALCTDRNLWPPALGQETAQVSAFTRETIYYLKRGLPWKTQAIS